jgi:AcrR family transcriptional regulator
MPERASYHHRDLPRAALGEAARLLARSEGDFTLPEIARRLGVSHAALYRHFRGRRGLLASLAAEAYADFGALLAERTAGLAGAALLAATFRAYFEFATEHRGHFRALFHPELRDKGDLPELDSVARGSFEGFVEILRGAGLDPDPASAALTWSAIHGLAVLWLDGWLPGRSGLSAEARAELPEALARMVIDGLRPR